MKASKINQYFLSSKINSTRIYLNHKFTIKNSQLTKYFSTTRPIEPTNDSNNNKAEEKYPDIFEKYETYQQFLTEIKTFDKEKTENYHYKILKCDKQDPPQKIQTNFHSFIKVMHPDRISATDESERQIMTETFAKLSESYKILSKEETRKAYDEEQISDGEYFNIISLFNGRVKINLFM